MVLAFFRKSILWLLSEASWKSIRHLLLETTLNNLDGLDMGGGFCILGWSVVVKQVCEMRLIKIVLKFKELFLIIF